MTEKLQYAETQEQWHRPLTMYVVQVWVWHDNIACCCVYADSMLQAGKIARKKYPLATLKHDMILGNVMTLPEVEITFDADGVSNVWVW